MHQVYCTGKLRFRCPECGHTTKNLMDLLLKHTHCKVGLFTFKWKYNFYFACDNFFQYGASKYGCTDCLCPFFGEHEREMHKKWCTKNKKKPWQCTNTGCSKRYSSRCRLREHVYKVLPHSTLCKICLPSFIALYCLVVRFRKNVTVWRTLRR